MTSHDLFAVVSNVASTLFVAALSAGSDRLRSYSESLLANSWSDGLPPAFAGSYRPGDVVRDCIILRPLGRGGMGEVYKAIHRQLRRLVAIKVVIGERGRTPLFAREALNAARLLHPNIVSVFDAEPRRRQAVRRHGVRRRHHTSRIPCQAVA